jgi:tRNA splicing ligase
VVGVPQHVIQRGNNRQVIFAGDGDIKDYDSFYLNDFLKRLKPLLGKKLKKGRGRPVRWRKEGKPC